jgi:CubicO group peptidase (beta-lactamase class C family)
MIVFLSHTERNSKMAARIWKISLALPLLSLMTFSAVMPALAAPRLDGPTDPAELEAFIDDFMAAHLEPNHVAGAAISVVKDGQVFFAKGYGYADVQNRVPVDPDTTLFDTGSVGKPFTWTAVMQLVEQGKLDLNADVNTYLDFNIPATYPEPITLIHLMTHTPGLEERLYGIEASTPEKLVPLGEWLARNIPARVRRPGEFSSYSNYGASLAGYVVQRVSGMSYDEYIETNILKPLGMVNTTSRQPLPPELAAQMSGGYTYANGAYQAERFQLLNIAPAGSVRASATDMARFMIAHLQNGRYGEARILEEATARQMQRRLFTHDERVWGYTYGFFDQTKNGQRIIWHSGETDFFKSALWLLPDHNVGLFVSTNSPGGETLRNLLFEAFMDRYYPMELQPLHPPADFAKRATRFTGSYQLNSHSYATWEKVLGLFGYVATMSIGAADDGTLIVDAQRFVETEPLVFRAVDGDDVLIFREDAQDNIKYVFSGRRAFEKQVWYEVPLVHYVLLATCMLLFISVIIAAPVGFFVSRSRADRQPQPRPAHAARWALGGAAALSLSFVVLFVVATDPIKVLTGEAPLLNVLGFISIPLAFLTIGAVVFTVLAWKNQYWDMAERVYYTLVTLAAVAFVGFLHYWDLLGAI